jgi:glycopeptide antibiotics resistance protein
MRFGRPVLSVNNNKRSILGPALLIYMSGMVLLVTLIPFQFRAVESIVFHWRINPSDLVMNVFLFLPLGFLYSLSRGKESGDFCIPELGFGIVLSLMIEIFQAHIPGRFTSGYDVVANGSGAWLGAKLLDYFRMRMETDRLVLVFALEIPLMNLIYLLVPLFWLSGISSVGEPARLWLILLLGIFGSGLLGAIYINRLKKSGLSVKGYIFYATGWFVISTIPAAINFPVQTVSIWIMIFIMILMTALFAKRKKRRSRRFELPTLKKLLPLYLLYIFLITLWPTTPGMYDLQAGYIETSDRIATVARFVDFIGAFTLLGYMITEMRGRKRETLFKNIALLIVIFLSWLVLHVIVRGGSTFHVLDVAVAFLIVAASFYGSMIYRLQLAAIQRL